MEGFTIGFFILAGLIYAYFTLQYFFTQLFYSKYNILVLFAVILGIAVITFLISSKTERIENILYCSGFLYYAILLYLIKIFYRRLNSFLVARRKMKPKFAGKGFTYVSYHKGIFDRGNSWNEDLATSPSWLDHLFSWGLIIFPFVLAFITVAMYRNSNQLNFSN